MLNIPKPSFSFDTHVFLIGLYNRLICTNHQKAFLLQILVKWCIIPLFKNRWIFINVFYEAFYLNFMLFSFFFCSNLSI